MFITSLYSWAKIINLNLKFSKGKSGFWRVFWILKPLQDVVPAVRHRALCRSPVRLRLLSVPGGEMLQPAVLRWNEGLFLGTSDTVQTMDGPGQEITRYHPRQVCLLLLQSLPTSVLFDEWTQMVSYLLWRMSPRQEVSPVMILSNEWR